MMKTATATIMPGTRKSWAMKRPDGGATGGSPLGALLFEGELASGCMEVSCVGRAGRGRDGGLYTRPSPCCHRGSAPPGKRSAAAGVVSLSDLEETQNHGAQNHKDL